MEIKRNGSQASSKGPASSFTGSVRRDPILTAEPPSRLATGYVTFEPSARTHWHTHPVGQLLVITSGRGRVGTLRGPVADVGTGDVVWFAAGEKHWHGGGPDTAMTHIAVTEAVDGTAVEWMEPVTDEDYAGG